MPRTTAASAPYATQALVLRARPLGEKDRILTLFSPEKGRFAAVAKGARGTKSKLAALAQPFILARFLLNKGRSLDIVNQAQIERAHADIAGDMGKAAWASFACEIVDNLPEGMPDAYGFEILSVFLATVEHAADLEALEAIGAWFQAQWLAHQGYGAVIGFCASCGDKITVSDKASSSVAFSPPEGGTLCENCIGFETAHLTVSAATLRALHRLERSRRAPSSLADFPFNLNQRESGELATLLRRSLAYHLTTRLRSQAFLDEIRAAHRLGQPG